MNPHDDYLYWVDRLCPNLTHSQKQEAIAAIRATHHTHRAAHVILFRVHLALNRGRGKAMLEYLKGK